MSEGRENPTFRKVSEFLTKHILTALISFVGIITNTNSYHKLTFELIEIHFPDMDRVVMRNN